MTPRHYSFDSVWRIPAPCAATFEVVADLEHYARWWPQVRSVTGIDDDTARVAVRSFLPYTLHLTLHRTRVDSEAGHLLAEIAGDLDGWASWRLRDGGGGTTVLRYAQEVVTTEPWMNAAGLVLAPVFRLNHAVMMRGGRDGLTRYLAA